jgi:SAM-dependent methyltransferase
VLDVGCGDGGLVRRLVAAGFDAVGVDPCAPDEPRLVRVSVEDATGLGRFHAVAAVMSLHHARLDGVVPAIARLLRPGGQLFVSELDWPAYDERAARWVAERGSDGHYGHADDPSVAAWREEHAGLHDAAAVRAALADAFAVESDTPRPYLARMLGRPELEREEEALIEGGALPALGWWYVGRYG